MLVNKFYMIYVENGSAPTVKHTTYADAISEARRLSIKNIGKKIHILESSEFLISEEPAVHRYSYDTEYPASKNI